MAGTLTVQNLQGPASGANANKIIVPSSHELYAAGHVVQVVEMTSVSGFYFSTTLLTYTTGVYGYITPKFSTSKILITGTLELELTSGNYPTIFNRLLRDSSVIQLYQYRGYEGTSNDHRIFATPIDHYDAPATTSPVYYEVQGANQTASTPSGTYNGGMNIRQPSRVFLMEIAQ